ncbi:phage tail tube protein [Paracoccus sulfuroxidans]|uniref:Lambda phage tail tube protein N-terminal domain-containing protein n=1 Tax=Paracoccus sulfuroxidans TaxID=384678 RepID=A0A562NQ34_9RHOB|nr:phage tail tube protein [Paracoccus sulfuroxidans]AZV00342.1 tail protein [Paracoccus phage vB_PsuS_Psul1]TWI34304.1 hypothetical protein IQ24_01819 [Paracoccus sulfuroxidans]
MPEGMIGYGSSVRIGRGATPAWTSVALVGDLELPDEQADEIDVTHMLSPGRRKQYIAGLLDSGELTIPTNWIPGSPTDTLLQGLKVSGEQVLIEITITAEGTPETFSGFLKSYARSAPINDKMTANAVFRLSEQVVTGG